MKKSRHSDTGVSRRALLSGGTGAALLACALPLPALASTEMRKPAKRIARDGGSRAERAYEMRLEAAESERDLHAGATPANGDEDRYPDRAASYSKGLRHDVRGIVAAVAYAALLAALRSEKPADFERLPVPGVVKLSNPQAAFADT